LWREGKEGWKGKEGGGKGRVGGGGLIVHMIRYTFSSYYIKVYETEVIEMR
jgi:hypothetical protein